MNSYSNVSEYLCTQIGDDQMVRTVYLDNNATTYMKKDVLDAMLPYYTEHFGNASSKFY